MISDPRLPTNMEADPTSLIVKALGEIKKPDDDDDAAATRQDLRQTINQRPMPRPAALWLVAM